MTGYTETIREYAADDRRIGLLDPADGTGEIGLNSGEIGQRLAVRFTLRHRAGLVDAVRFQVFGCGFTIAACAAAAELAEGHPLGAVASIRPEWVAAVLGGLPEDRYYCAELAVAALHAAVASARRGQIVQSSVGPADDDEHGARVTAADPLYRALIDSPGFSGIAGEDRHVFACLLAVAAQESGDVATALGLSNADLAAILARWFPAFDPAPVLGPTSVSESPPPPINEGLLHLLLSHVPTDHHGVALPASRWLARILAARAAHPGHLWRAMGLFARPELTAAIRRHLPSLAAANHQGMRWKRFLFKQLCELSGGSLCPSPDCGKCGDYPLCFGEE